MEPNFLYRTWPKSNNNVTTRDVCPKVKYDVSAPISVQLDHVPADRP